MNDTKSVKEILKQAHEEIQKNHNIVLKSVCFPFYKKVDGSVVLADIEIDGEVR